jgi:hypothetical protein
MVVLMSCLEIRRDLVNYPDMSFQEFARTLRDPKG